VALSIESRRIGDITIVSCAGKIVEGAESTALREKLDSLIPLDPFVVLNLGGVDFLDSSGLGLLVRFLTRTRVAQGHFKLCALPKRISEVLRLSRLASTFDVHESEAEAVAACYKPAQSGATGRLSTDVLCVEASGDLLHYIREVLAQAGYGVITTTNLHDALILLQATRPKAVVISAELRASRHTNAADAFNGLVNAATVVELPVGFSSDDAGAAAGQLLDQVRTIVSDGKN
jgi:anti-sigma B factor antagonist